MNYSTHIDRQNEREKILANVGENRKPAKKENLWRHWRSAGREVLRQRHAIKAKGSWKGRVGTGG